MCGCGGGGWVCIRLGRCLRVSGCMLHVLQLRCSKSRPVWGPAMMKAGQIFGFLLFPSWQVQLRDQNWNFKC